MPLLDHGLIVHVELPVRQKPHDASGSWVNGHCAIAGAPETLGRFWSSRSRPEVLGNRPSLSTDIFLKKVEIILINLYFNFLK